MNESTFNALIKLLDDNDPDVVQQVEREIISLGTQVIDRLERAWETADDTSIQQRLEDLIARMQVTQYTDRLYKWRLDGGRNLLDGWICVSQIQFPTLNEQKYKGEINRLVNKIWLQTNVHMNHLEKLCVVNKLLYTQHNFTGNYTQNDKPENNYLSYVLDTSTGNSLSLSALYYLICREIEIPVQVINFNGYYALRYYNQNSHFYIDAYNKGMFFTPQQVEQFLRKLNVDENVLHYKQLSNIYIVLHLIEHLIDSYRTAGNHDKAAVFTQLLKDIDVRFDEA
jgi:regulator of sirC expression with transglutaminase-like and TPR domain